MDKNKLVLPIIILSACIILGGFIFASQVIKQNSIEKQQQIDLQAKKEADQAKAEQDKRDYIAKRKVDCYDILERERKAFSNTRDGYYDEEDDVCRITYKAVKGEWEGRDCETLKPAEGTSGSLATYFWREYFNCKDNTFNKEY